MRCRRLLLLVVVLFGCKPSSTGGGTTRLATTTTLEVTTTTSASSFAVPAVIDLSYVQRVLEAIYHLDGEAARHAYAVKSADNELKERLDAIYGGPALADATQVYERNAAEGFSQFANPPGDAKVSAVTIIQATPTCIVARADLDHGPFFRKPGKPAPQSVIQLGPADILPLNPTGWGVVVAGDPNRDQKLEVCS